MTMKNRFWLKLFSILLTESFFFTQIVSASNLVENRHLRTKPLAATDGGIQKLRQEFAAKDGGSRSLKVGELELKAETIPDLLAMQIEKYGDRTSLVTPVAQGYQEISFRQVGDQATQIAKAMYTHGVRQGDKVGFLSPNRPDFGISTYSVLKLGGAVVPMAFRAKPAALQHMVSNSDTTFLVVAAPFLGVARTLKASNSNIRKIFVLDNVPGLQEDEISLASWKEETPVILPEVQISPEDVALILYTSGSTKKLPKGVPLTHKNLLYNMEASRMAWEKSFTDGEMTLGWLPFFHVMGLPHEFWKNLYVGARYAFPRLKPGPPTPDQLIQALRETKANVLYTAPYMLEGFKAMAEGEVWEVELGGERIMMRFTKDPSVLETLRGLKFIMSGGVALTRELGEYFQGNSVNVIQGEGMSDVGGAIFLSDPEERDPHTLRLIPGMNAKFVPVEGLDANELVLADSPTTTAGYLKSPDETAEAFREDGFHTGDLFKEVRPGRYVFVGRTDDVDKTSKAEKVNKLAMERGLEQNPVIQRAAVIVSQRPRPAVLIKPAYEALRGKQWAEIEQRVWEAVEAVNAELPKFSQIRRDHIMILAPDEGLPLSPKQSLIRPQVEKMYADRIEAVYTQDARNLEAKERRDKRLTKVRRKTGTYQNIVKRVDHRDLAFAVVEEARRIAAGRGPTRNVIIRGEKGHIAEAVAVGRGGAPVQLTTSQTVLDRMQGSIDRLAEALEAETHVYGVTTLFGQSANQDVRSDQLSALQHELIRMESAGIGDGLPTEVIRASMYTRLNNNMRGDSAIRKSVLDSIATLLNKGITPDVPDTGTISASGDLAPNAHVIGVIVGRHDAEARDPEGKIISAREALRRAGLEPVQLGPKEGLAGINGTNFAVGEASLVLHDAHILALLAQALTALSEEAMKGTTQDFAPFTHERRGDPQQEEVARNIRDLLAGSQLVRHELGGQPMGEASAHGPNEEIQTHYHLRTAAPWLAPQVRILTGATEVVNHEINASTDNPLVDPIGGGIYQGGNFQGANVAAEMESVRRALALIGQLIHRQFSEIVNRKYNNGLPDNLAGADPNLRPDVGLKGMEIDMSGWLSKLNFLANPVTTHTQSAEGHNQTLNSLAFLSAQITADAVKVLQIMMTHHLYALAQAIDLRNIERAYREATEEAITKAVNATLPALVANPEEVAPLLIRRLVKRAKDIPPFHYVHTTQIGYKALMDELLREIDAIFLGEDSLSQEIEVEGVKIRFKGDFKEMKIGHVSFYHLDFGGSLNSHLHTLLPQAKERALQQGASHLLGRTRSLYDFVRRDLGVPFNSAEADLAPGPQAKIIRKAIEDGRIVEPLFEAFFPTPTVAEWRAAQEAERSAKTGDTTAADGASKITDAASLRPIEKVAVIGGGQMGAAFAMTAALSGLTVTVRDMDEAALGRARARVEEGITGALKRRKLDEAGAAALRERITYTTELREAVSGADLVFEAVFEDPDVKRQLFAELDSLLGPDVVLLSNTSSISVDELAPARSTFPEMVGGMHLFDPVWSQRVVEVVERKGADPRVLAQTLVLARQLGKEPVVVKNSPAFVYNRLFIPLFNEMLRLYGEGFSPEAIDTVAEELFGAGARLFWYGASNNPERSETLLKTHYAATSQLQRQFQDNFYTPPSVLSKNLERIERREALWEIHEGAPVDRSDFPKIEERLLGAVFAMAGQLIDEGIVVGERPHRTIDYGTSMLFGWRQGPFEMMNEWGLKASLQLVEKLRQRYPGLVVPESLKRLALQEGTQWPLEYVHLEVALGVGTITIDRPEALNALNQNVMRELRERFEAALHDPKVNVIVLRGSGGKSFVAGADLKFFIDNSTPDRLQRIVDFTREGQELFHAIDISFKPVVAEVDGYALGGGLELALAADAIVAGPNALFRFPEVTQVGIYPGLGGTYRTPQKVGKAVAKWMILTGAPLKAQQAYEVGLVDVAPKDVAHWMEALKESAAQGGLSVKEFRQEFILTARERTIPDFISAFNRESVDEIVAGLEERAKGSKDASRALTALQGGAPIARDLANRLIEGSPLIDPDDLEIQNLDIFLTEDARVGLTTPIGKPRVFTGAPASAADGGTHPFALALQEATGRITALIPDEAKDLHAPSLIEIFEAIEHDPEVTKTPGRLALAKVLARNALRSITLFSEDPYVSDLSPIAPVPSGKQKVIVLSTSRLLDPGLNRGALNDLLQKTEGSLFFVTPYDHEVTDALKNRFGDLLFRKIWDRSIKTSDDRIRQASFVVFLLDQKGLGTVEHLTRYGNLSGSKTFTVSLKEEVDVAKEIQLGMRLAENSSLLNNVSTLDLATQILLAEVSGNLGKLMKRHPTLETELKEAETVVTRIVKGL